MIWKNSYIFNVSASCILLTCIFASLQDWSITSASTQVIFNGFFSFTIFCGGKFFWSFNLHGLLFVLHGFLINLSSHSRWTKTALGSEIRTHSFGNIRILFSQIGGCIKPISAAKYKLKRTCWERFLLSRASHSEIPVIVYDSYRKSRIKFEPDYGTRAADSLFARSFDIINSAISRTSLETQHKMVVIITGYFTWVNWEAFFDLPNRQPILISHWPKIQSF